MQTMRLFSGVGSRGATGLMPLPFFEMGGQSIFWPPHFSANRGKGSLQFQDPYRLETLYLLDLVQYSQPVLELPRLFSFSIQSGNRRGRVNM